MEVAFGCGVVVSGEGVVVGERVVLADRVEGTGLVVSLPPFDESGSGVSPGCKEQLRVLSRNESAQRSVETTF